MVKGAVGRGLADVSHRFYARGWVLGTSGNFSVVASREPLRLAITASGRDKRTLRPADIVIVDDAGQLAPVANAGASSVSNASSASSAAGRPSAETLLHVVIAQRRRVGAILHTHSVWSTILSEAHAAAGGLAIEGYEML
jgi:methylthioribulose-1-phosphate dehydratase